MLVRNQKRSSRRGSIIVLSCFLIVFMLGLCAFAIDMGVIMLMRTQLQVAADSAAMAAGAVLGMPGQDSVATAKQFAAYHHAGGAAINLATSDIENGTWDSSTRTFTPSTAVGNAVRVTARRNANSGANKLFFGPIYGMNSVNIEASAVAMGNPRDICFVIDLSGSMNNDTETCWATADIDSQYSSSIGTTQAQQVYTDFGYGSFPGTSQHVGSVLGVTADDYAYANMTKNSGVLTASGIQSTYKISSSDSESTRKTKAYKYIIDKQIAVIMPSAKPTPNSSTNYNYWEKYLDYIIKSVSSTSSTGGSGRGTLPPNQDSDRMSSMNSGTSSYNNKIGYRTYVQFMMDMGRDHKPDGTNYTPLSTASSNCPYHTESVSGLSFTFPPSEQPTHSARRSIMAAIKVVKDRNASVPDASLRDWVSLVTYDTVSGSVLKTSLTSDYTGVMETCSKLQCVYDGQASTATETGLILAKNHIKPSNQGGSGRLYTNKVVVLLTDGVANLKSSSNSTISSYRNANPDTNYYGDDYESDAALMQAAMMQGDKWRLYSCALGSGADWGFMDRMARMGGTEDDNGQAPRTSGDPSAYETELSNIFTDIITSPAVRLVK